MEVDGLSSEDVSRLLDKLASHHPALVKQWSAAAIAAAAGSGDAGSSSSSSSSEMNLKPAAKRQRPETPLASPSSSGKGSKKKTNGDSATTSSSAAAPIPGSIVIPESIHTVSKLPPVVTPPSSRGFDMRRYRLRHIALHVAYLGSAYAGFSSQEGPAGLADGTQSASTVKGRTAPAPSSADAAVATVETALFGALQQACLIDSRDGSGYTRCGRTDRGVSAAGQIIALRIRSKARRFDTEAVVPVATATSDVSSTAGAAASPSIDADDNDAPPTPSYCTPKPMWTRRDPATGTDMHNGEDDAVASGKDAVMVGANSNRTSQRRGEPFPPPSEELDYCSVLNSLLPKDIRVLGWGDVPADFSARFSCTTRVYRYYFPGRGLDIDAMRQAAGLLQGMHDFRNVARIDIANTQNFIRALGSLRIVKVDEGVPAARRRAVVATSSSGASPAHPLLVESHSIPAPWAERVTPYEGSQAQAKGDGSSTSSSAAAAEPPIPHNSQVVQLLRSQSQALADADAAASSSAPNSSSNSNSSGTNPLDTSMYYLQVTGNAFLWHQVRCLVSLLFHVGRGYEAPDTLSWLLDVAACPARPQYAMAPDAPLVLYHCGFGEEGPEVPVPGVGLQSSSASGAAAPAVVESISPANNVAAGTAAVATPSAHNDGDEGEEGDEVMVTLEGTDGPSSRSSAIDPSLYKPTRFRRSHPSLYASMYHSPASLRKVTAELEAEWSATAVRAHLLRGLLDRLYALHVDEEEVTKLVQGGRGAGGEKAKGAAAVSTSSSSTITWGEAVARCSSCSSRWDASIIKPLVALEDCEMSIHGLPALANANAAEGQTGNPSNGGRNGAKPAPTRPPLPPPHSSVPIAGRGGYVPFAARPTGMSVGDKWRQLSDKERAAVTAMHPVNAAKLAAELGGGGGGGTGGARGGLKAQ